MLFSCLIARDESFANKVSNCVVRPCERLLRDEYWCSKRVLCIFVQTDVREGGTTHPQRPVCGKRSLISQASSLTAVYHTILRYDNKVPLCLAHPRRTRVLFATMSLSCFWSPLAQKQNGTKSFAVCTMVQEVSWVHKTRAAYRCSLARSKNRQGKRPPSLAPNSRLLMSPRKNTL